MKRHGRYVQRFRGGNIDEGWTHFVLEEFKFPFTSIFDPEIKAGNLNAKYDVLIIPNDSTATITGEAPAEARGAAAEVEEAAGEGGRRGGGRGNMPAEFRTGLGNGRRQRHTRLHTEGRHAGHAQWRHSFSDGPSRHRSAQRPDR